MMVKRSHLENPLPRELKRYDLDYYGHHFKHKEEMLLAIYQQLSAEQRRLLTDTSLSPIFANFDFFIAIGNAARSTGLKVVARARDTAVVAIKSAIDRIF